MMFSHCLIAIIVFVSTVVADKIFVTSPVTGGIPWTGGKAGEIQWEPVMESATPPFPNKIGIDLMYGDDNAATKAMTIVGKQVDPRAGSYRWEKIPKSLDPNPPGGGYFLRLGSVADGYFYGSRFQIKGLTGESSPDDTPSTTATSDDSSTTSNSEATTTEDSVATAASAPRQTATTDEDAKSQRTNIPETPRRSAGNVCTLSYSSSFVACALTFLAANLFF